MDPGTVERLLALNREFYERFGEEFAHSRRKLHRGIQRALVALDPLGDVLDLGCGDGRVGRAVAGGAARFRSYLGVDTSERLLGIARSGPAAPRVPIVSGVPDAPRGESAAMRSAGPELDSPAPLAFASADLSDVAWRRSLALADGSFDTILSFSVLQHLPSSELRRRHLSEMRLLLREGGRIGVSVWNFLHLERFRGRIVPWADAGIDEGAVEPGDLLLEWREGGRGIRYVHHFTPEELSAVLREAGFAVEETYRSDGETGDLGVYALAAR
jgi:SAM-dependent methyltransferase